MDFFLKIVSYGTPALLAFMGAVVTFCPPQPNSRKQTYWLVAFGMGGLISVGAAVWQSERNDAWLRQMITGGDNYAYLVADKGDLAARKKLIRLWVCATGDIYFLAMHPYPYGSKTDDPAYVSIPGVQKNYHGPGCSWAGTAVTTGKFSVDSQARNRTVYQILELTETESGPFTQKCSIDDGHGGALPAPNCEAK